MIALPSGLFLAGSPRWFYRGQNPLSVLREVAVEMRDAPVSTDVLNEDCLVDPERRRSSPSLIRGPDHPNRDLFEVEDDGTTVFDTGGSERTFSRRYLDRDIGQLASNARRASVREDWKVHRLFRGRPKPMGKSANC